MSDQPPDPAAMRREYFVRIPGVGFLEEDLAPTWLDQFRQWFADAVASPEVVEPNAMVVGTASRSGQPSARTVLLKAVDERGFVFYTNYRSRKATEATENPYASLVFPWHPIGRQVVVGGSVERIDRADTESYFATRPRSSQLGAWASPQSQVVSRAELAAAMVAAEERFPADGPVPAPPDWGGMRVRPQTVEFWYGQAGRLHDRLRYRFAEGAWVTERLGP